MIGPFFCEHTIASVILSGLGAPIELDPNLGLSLDLLFLRLFFSCVPAVLSDRNNSESEFLTVAWQLHLNGLNSTFYFFN